jgi:hypothetical protein
LDGGAVAKQADEDIYGLVDVLKAILGAGPDWPPAEDIRPVGRKGSRKGLPTQAPLSPKMKELADRLGLSYDSFFGRMEKRTHFRAYELRRLLPHIEDVRLIDYLLEDCGYVAATRVKVDERPELNIQEAMHNMVHHMSSVVRIIEQSLRDDRVSAQDRQQIHYEVIEAESALAALRRLVTDEPH